MKFWCVATGPGGAVELGTIMPSVSHQALTSLFRDSPALGLSLFQETTGVTLPRGVQARPHTAQFTDLYPAEYSADAAYLLEDRETGVHGALIIEVQLSADDSKRASWLQYVATLHRALRRPVTLLAVAITETMARWCSEPYVYDHVGSTFQPVVIGPRAIPRITEIERARQFPALAVLSVAAHGQEAFAEAIAIPAYLACAALDSEEGERYADAILIWLNEGARRALEEFMSLDEYEFQSDYFKKRLAKGFEQGIEKGLEKGLEQGLEKGREQGLEKGREQGLEKGLTQGREEGRIEGQHRMLIMVLGHRFGALPDAALQRIRTAGNDQLERWAGRVLDARTLDDVLAD